MDDALRPDPPVPLALGEAELAGVLAIAASLAAADDPAARATAAELQQAARLDPQTLARAQALHRLQAGLVGLTPADRRWFALKRFVAGLPASLLPQPAAVDPQALRLSAHVLAGRAEAARQAERYRLATWLAHRALAHDPGCYKAWFELGRALAQRGRPEEACDAYRLAIAHGVAEPVVHDPLSLSGALNNLATLVEGAVGDDVAEALYQKALAIRPTNGIAAYNLALLYKARGRLAEAEAKLVLAAALRPDDPDAASELAIVRAARQLPSDPTG